MRKRREMRGRDDALEASLGVGQGNQEATQVVRSYSSAAFRRHPQTGIPGSTHDAHTHKGI